MDTLSFTAKLIEVLAWPVASVVLVVLLRGEIKRLLPLVKKLKAGPLEAEFEREVNELRTTVQANHAQTSEAVASWQPNAEQLAGINPRSAILEAWREIETTGRRLLRELDPQLSEEQLRSTREVVRLLGEKGVLSLEEATTLSQMRFLRNQAVHVEEFRPTYESAMNFVQLSAYLLQRMHSRRVGANPSIERTSTGGLRPPAAAAHVER
jgi:hypothetical protein